LAHFTIFHSGTQSPYYLYGFFAFLVKKLQTALKLKAKDTIVIRIGREFRFSLLRQR